MKGFLVTVLSVLVVFAFVGCASAPAADKPADQPAADKPADAAPAADKPADAAPAAAAVDFSKGANVIPVGSALPAGNVEVIDNFEDGEYWVPVGDSWDQWGSHNLSLVAALTSEKGVTEGANAYEWSFDVIPEAGGQATFFTDQPPFTDFAGTKYMVIDIENPQDFPVTLVFNCQTTDGWKWSQTADAVIPPGKHTVVFNLTTEIKDGSNAALTEIPGLAEMKRLMFTVTKAEGKNGTLYADNVRIIR